MGSSSPGLTRMGLPGSWIQQIQLAFGDPTGNYTAYLEPYDWVFKVFFNVSTAWAGGSGSSVNVGDSASATQFLTTPTLTSTGMTVAADSTAKRYTAANNVIAAYTIGTDTAGAAQIMVLGAYDGDTANPSNPALQ